MKQATTRDTADSTAKSSKQEMSGEEGKRKGLSPVSGGGDQSQPHSVPPQYYYGTFQGVTNYQQPPPPPPPPQQAVIGFPQPIPPAGAPGHHSHYYSHSYQSVPGYTVAEGRPVREHRLPCCGIGIGWSLFITGFLLGAIPWYIGVFVLLCVRVDYREKPGLISCTLAAALAMIAVTFGLTKATHSW